MTEQSERSTSRLTPKSSASTRGAARAQQRLADLLGGARAGCPRRAARALDLLLRERGLRGAPHVADERHDGQPGQRERARRAARTRAGSTPARQGRGPPATGAAPCAGSRGLIVSGSVREREEPAQLVCRLACLAGGLQALGEVQARLCGERRELPCEARLCASASAVSPRAEGAGRDDQVPLEVGIRGEPARLARVRDETVVEHAVRVGAERPPGLAVPVRIGAEVVRHGDRLAGAPLASRPRRRARRTPRAARSTPRSSGPPSTSAVQDRDGVVLERPVDELAHAAQRGPRGRRPTRPRRRRAARGRSARSSRRGRARARPPRAVAPPPRRYRGRTRVRRPARARKVGGSSRSESSTGSQRRAGQSRSSSSEKSWRTGAEREVPLVHGRAGGAHEAPDVQRPLEVDALELRPREAGGVVVAGMAHGAVLDPGHPDLVELGRHEQRVAG